MKGKREQVRSMNKAQRYEEEVKDLQRNNRKQKCHTFKLDVSVIVDYLEHGAPLECHFEVYVPKKRKNR